MLGMMCFVMHNHCLVGFDPLFNLNLMAGQEQILQPILQPLKGYRNFLTTLKKHIHIILKMMDTFSPPLMIGPYSLRSELG